MDIYDLVDYGEMIADSVRMDAYALALKSVVRPDSVVLDIGTGSGIHALLAAKFGARKVYAVEPNDAVHLAREVAKANGFGDRIEFYQDLSTNVTLPERAEVIVSDIRGSLPMFGDHIPTIVDARKRHLAKNGVLIPHKDMLFVALVDSRSAYREMLEAWSRPYGLDMDLIRQMTLNSWSDTVPDLVRKWHLLTEPFEWGVLDYGTITDPSIHAEEIALEATREGVAHGWLVWFDTDLTPDVGFSNEPGASRISRVYGRGFFPLLTPVPVQNGDSVQLSIHAELEGGDYEWRWHTRIEGSDGESKFDHEGSTTVGKGLNASLVLEGVRRNRPSLSDHGGQALYVLNKLDGEATLEEIAEGIKEKFPVNFESMDAAILYVHEICQQFRN